MLGKVSSRAAESLSWRWKGGDRKVKETETNKEREMCV